LRHTFFVTVCGAAVLASLVAGCSTAPAGARIDNVPMYGQPNIERPDILKKADENFIKDATAAVGSRERASKVWATQAEEFMKAGNLDFAMRRYNQSWLLDPNNYQPYWGFGRVLVEQKKYEEALTFLERSQQLINDDYQKAALLSDVGNVYAILGFEQKNIADRSRYFTLANQYYEQSVSLDPKYPNPWAWWAWNSYNEGKYADAWKKVKRARELGWSKFSESFLRDLSAKMPEPQ
jgi:tetratricopeptide (TPR) repeat protein